MDLSKSARLDYFGRDPSGIYIWDRPIPWERNSPTRIRHAWDKQESFDACLPACEKEGNEVTQFQDRCTSRANMVQPMTLPEL